MKRIVIYAVISVIALGLIVGLIVRRNMSVSPGARRKTAGTVASVRLKGEFDIQNAFINVADSVGKSVVAISTERTQKMQQPQPFRFKRFQSPFGGQDPFEKFFEDFFGQFPEREFKQRGLGSGFIVDKEGHIITNYHVVQGADKINITLSDGRAFLGTVQGADPRSDLAVIKIKAKNLPVAELGNSDLVQTGEWVVALGNPFGHMIKSPKPTVTVGVVSALHRRIPMPGDRRGYLDLIQTDAAINPGNSGGPLCDLSGKVIGINVAIFTTTGGYQGVGFAIPVNVVKNILSDLIKGKEIAYGWLGVSVQNITPELQEYFKLSDNKGALIAQALPDSPAEKAGLTAGDIIKKFDGKDIENLHELLREVGKARVGEVVKVEVLRDGALKTIEVTIAKRPTQALPQEGKPAETPEEAKEWRGIKVVSITEDIAKRLNLRDKEGVAIFDINRQSPSYEAGLRKGDVIREINKKPIKNMEDYKSATSEAKGLALVRTDRGYFTIKDIEGEKK